MITPKRTRGLRFFNVRRCRNAANGTHRWIGQTIENEASIATGKKFSIRRKYRETLKFFISAKIEVKSPAKEEVTTFYNSNVSVEYLQQFDRKLFTKDVRNQLASVLTIFVALFSSFRDCCTIVSRSPVDRALNFSDRIEHKRVGERTIISTKRGSIEFLFLDGF